MMNLQNKDMIDVCQTYFHVDDLPIKKYAFIFKVDGNISMNRVISKNEAILFIRQKKGININRDDLSSLSISQEPLRIDYIRDFLNEKLFMKEDSRQRGWLLQYDPTPFANWYHDCFYYFIVNDDIYKEMKHNRGLSDAIKMQSL